MYMKKNQTAKTIVTTTESTSSPSLITYYRHGWNTPFLSS